MVKTSKEMEVNGQPYIELSVCVMDPEPHEPSIWELLKALLMGGKRGDLKRKEEVRFIPRKGKQEGWIDREYGNLVTLRPRREYV
jgi:hypothetical protein